MRRRVRRAAVRPARAKSYTVNAMFFSLQGEGARAGTPNVFVRFSGCNMRCDVKAGKRSPGGFACDTEFESGRAMSGAQILAAALRLAPGAGLGVIFTGGEPALQLDRKLVDAMRQAGFGPVCIETNGTIDVAPLGLDWISLSPKVAEHAVTVKACSELRYVRGYGQGLPRPRRRRPTGSFRRLSPAIRWMLRLCAGASIW